MKRQIDDYYDRFYNKLRDRFAVVSANDNRLAKEIAAWKESVAQRWDEIHVVSVERVGADETGQIVSDREFTVRVVVDERGLEDAIGAEIVILRTDAETGKDIVFRTFPMQVVSHEGNLYTFEVKANIDVAGSYRSAYRLFPKNKNLTSRQDMCYVKWA